MQQGFSTLCRKPVRSLPVGAGLALLLATVWIPQPSCGIQTHAIDLNGEWQISRAGAGDTQTIRVPNSLEDGLQTEYDGVSTWSRKVPAIAMQPGQRLWLRFAAVATRARVWFEDQEVGVHLGGWTPFTLDLTDVALAHADRREWTLRVEVDELVGHNTQGFLPVVTHHFGGIWQEVALEVRSPASIDRDASMVRGTVEGNPVAARLGIEAPVRLAAGAVSADLRLQVELQDSDEAVPGGEEGERMRGISGEWRTLGTLTATLPDGRDDTAVFSGNFDPGKVGFWSPGKPVLHRVRLTLRNRTGGAVVDQAVFQTGFSGFSTSGRTLQLNGKPIQVRGVLNWGYAPPRIAPAIDEAAMRNEIQFALERGFNLMKFCLWVPPKRYLELCDEMGILAWIEYPTWHPRLDADHLPDLQVEYREFFRFDRNHPSVALRSLTCETGPSADLNVIRDLYQLGKAMVPGALIVDDSSWIEWNRVNDFYDDHPYGNNHTWRETLARLNRYIAEREPKPLVLGEAIAADSWNLSDPWQNAGPFLQDAHSPWAIAANRDWLERMDAATAPFALKIDAERLHLSSLAYGQAMRKFQIETFRREVPRGGYVVSVIRDFPKAGMGLIGYDSQPKLPAGEWSFHGDQMLLLQTPGDCRSFESGQTVTLHWLLAGFDESPPNDSRVVWSLQAKNNGGPLASGDIPATQFAILDGALWKAAFELRLPDCGPHPTELELTAKLVAAGSGISSHWPVWVVPSVSWSARNVVLDGPFRQAVTDEWLLSIPATPVADARQAVWICDRMEPETWKHLMQGGRALILPNGGPASLPVEEHWFLRGSPAVPEPAGGAFGAERDPEGNAATARLIESLQHFDLAGPVIPRVDAWIGQTRPRAVLWDNHDLRECRTHGLWLDIPVGENGGWITVSALRHTGRDNAAGRWLLHEMIRELESRMPVGDAVHKLARDNAAIVDSNLSRRGLDLAGETWRFRPDPDGVGHGEEWGEAELESSTDAGEWKPIRIGEHWDGQGYGSLDGWGWYKTDVTLPQDWPEGEEWLVFRGVDDCCEVWINGQFAGKCGDARTRQSAFELRTALPVGRFFRPGKNQITFAVFDWQGAGGLFRPVQIATENPWKSLQIFLPR